MNEAVYLQSYERNTKKIKKYNPENDDELTGWIRAIRNATLEKRKSHEDWKDDSNLIQYKRMREEDLIVGKYPIPKPEHEYEEWLDVIKLPLKIPTEQEYAAPQFLFVRPDEYDLFECVGRVRHKNCYVLTGNPGISKSWFQWKFILLCYRDDLYKALRHVPKSTSEKEKGDEPESKPEVEQVLPFIPQLIVRTIRGKESYLFHVKVDTEVTHFFHSPEHLKTFSDENSTILWEPSKNAEEVEYLAVKARIIATVSPNTDRFQEFIKDRAEMLYMPCPSELQLRLMGQICRELFSSRELFSNSYPTDDEIHQRVKEYGPFIRIVLSISKDNLTYFERKRHDEIKTKFSNGETMQAALSLSEHITESTKAGLSGLSHRLVRFVVNREHSDGNEPYGVGNMSYATSSEEIFRSIRRNINRLENDQIISHLKSFNEGDMKYSDFLPVYFERLFKCYAEDGIKWKCLNMRSLVEDWQPYDVKFTAVAPTSPKYSDMTTNTLYYPSDPTFPLVDMYYMDDTGRLIGIQATSAKNHAKPVSTYERFYEKIGTDPEATPLHLYYLILPIRMKYYVKKKPNSDSFFWTNFCDKMHAKWKDNILFHVLVPPESFEAKY